MGGGGGRGAASYDHKKNRILSKVDDHVKDRGCENESKIVGNGGKLVEYDGIMVYDVKTVDNHGKWRKIVKRRKMVQKCGKMFKNGGK